MSRDMTITRKRLSAWCNLLTAEQIAWGRTWYPRAHEFAKALSKQYDIELDHVVGVIACLSVQCRWDVTQRDAESLCRAFHDGINLDMVTVATYSIQKDKAIAILNAPSYADIGGMIGTKYAPKTKAFYCNILNPESSIAVTIDRWIFRGLDLEQFTKGGGNRYIALYHQLVKVFHDQAAKMEMSPCELQAAVWCCIQQTADREAWEGSRPFTGLVAEDDPEYVQTEDDVAPF